MKRIIKWITELYWKFFDWSCQDCGKTCREHNIESSYWGKATRKPMCKDCGHLYWVNTMRPKRGKRAFYCDTCDRVSYVSRTDNIPSRQTTCGSCRDKRSREKLTKELV